MKSIHILTLLSFFIALRPSMGFGTNYFVSEQGSNDRSGLELSEAFATIQYAVGKVEAGDSIWVENGNYKGFVIKKYALPEMPIYIGALGEDVWITTGSDADKGRKFGIFIDSASHIVVSGFKITDVEDHGIKVTKSSFITLHKNTFAIVGGIGKKRFDGLLVGRTDDLIVSENKSFGNRVGLNISDNGDRPVIKGNEVYDNFLSGIFVAGDPTYGGDGLISKAIISHNILYNNGRSSAAINLDGAPEAVIFNNLICDNHNTGIALTQSSGSGPSHSALIYNNTIINMEDARWNIFINKGSYGAKIYNNILLNFRTDKGAIGLEPGSDFGFFSDHNLLSNRLGPNGDDPNIIYPLSKWQKCFGWDLNSQVAENPMELFVDFFEKDFSLKGSSSAVNAGSNIVADWVIDDITGTPRDIKIDIGAYEFQLPAHIESKITVRPFKIRVQNEQLVFEDLDIQDQIILFNIEGKILAQSESLNGNLWKFPINELSGKLILYRIVSPSFKKIHTGKILL